MSTFYTQYHGSSKFLRSVLFKTYHKMCLTVAAMSLRWLLYWAQWRLKPPASRLFTPPFSQVQINENIKSPRHRPLCREFTGDRWIPRTKGQWNGKCFHLMTSSCNKNSAVYDDECDMSFRLSVYCLHPQDCSLDIALMTRIRIRWKSTYEERQPATCALKY